MHSKASGVKARHMQDVTSMHGASAGDGSDFQILVISPEKNRIASFLRVLLARSGKRFSLDGHELYRKALEILDTPEGKKTVAMIVADETDDYDQPTEALMPLWKETILAFRNQYHEIFKDLIDPGYLPSHFTVITMFRKCKGEMKPQQLEAIQKEHDSIAAELGISFAAAQTDAEMVQKLDDEVISKIIQQQRTQSQLQSRKKSRADKIARATKLTAQASHK